MKVCRCNINSEIYFTVEIVGHFLKLNLDDNLMQT